MYAVPLYKFNFCCLNTCYIEEQEDLVSEKSDIDVPDSVKGYVCSNQTESLSELHSWFFKRLLVQPICWHQEKTNLH